MRCILASCHSVPLAVIPRPKLSRRTHVIERRLVSIIYELFSFAQNNILRFSKLLCCTGFPDSRLITVREVIPLVP